MRPRGLGPQSVAGRADCARGRGSVTSCHCVTGDNFPNKPNRQTERPKCLRAIIYATPDLLESNREFRELLRRGEIELQSQAP